MKIGPVDIRNHTFQRKTRGIDDAEVRAYLDLVADRLEEAIQEAIQLREAGERTAQDIREYRAMEKALRESLVAAERITEERLGIAEREARLIVKNAEVEGEKIVAHAREWSARYRAELEDLRRQRTTFLERFRALLSSQSKILEASAKDFMTIESGPTLPADLPPLREIPAPPPAREGGASRESSASKDAAGARDAAAAKDAGGARDIPTFAHPKDSLPTPSLPANETSQDAQSSQISQEAAALAALKELQSPRFAFAPASVPLTGSFVQGVVPSPPPLPSSTQPGSGNPGPNPAGNAHHGDEGLFIPDEGAFAEGDRG